MNIIMKTQTHLEIKLNFQWQANKSQSSKQAKRISEFFFLFQENLLVFSFFYEPTTTTTSILHFVAWKKKEREVRTLNEKEKGAKKCFTMLVFFFFYFLLIEMSLTLASINIHRVHIQIKREIFLFHLEEENERQTYYYDALLPIHDMRTHILNLKQ